MEYTFLLAIKNTYPDAPKLLLGVFPPLTMGKKTGNPLTSQGFPECFRQDTDKSD